MRCFVSTLILFALFLVSAVAQEGESWVTQQPVWQITAVKIHPNMGEQYLNNLKKTWVVAMEAAKELGAITNYKILGSLTPNDEGYNLLLIVESPSLASFDATEENRERGDQIEEMVRKSISDAEAEKISGTVYPEVRTILSQKMLREIKFTD